MGFSISSIGHGFSIALKDTLVGLKAVEKVLVSVAGNPAFQAAVETASAITLGPGSVEIERAVFAVAGELASVLHSGDPATVAHLTAAGMNPALMADYQKLVQSMNLTTPVLVVPVKA